MKRPKVLLTNSFAVNNGDLALIIALYKQLVERGYSVSIATFYYKFLSKQYPGIPFVRELLDYRFLNKFTFLKTLFLKWNFRFNKRYREHDVFIASPGGYVNSYYGIKRCLLPLLQAKSDAKKTAIYAQSVGPLNSMDETRLTEFSKSIDVIMVRDDYSRDCLKSIVYHSKFLQSKDAAFLLPPRQSVASRDTKRVAVSVRRWEHDARDMKTYYELVKLLCRLALESGYDIEFISTCQGVMKYRDDSKEAHLIAHELIRERPEWVKRISVDSGYHTFYELTDLLNSRYSFTIGTRLHMCILSMINGMPAFNISYEVKGLECFRYLDIENCSVDFNEPVSSAEKKFKYFLTDLESVRLHVAEQVQQVHEESKQSLTEFLRVMEM